MYFLNGFTGLVYLHLDCVDGKQARRTKSSSPLGQLFDHGTPLKEQTTVHALEYPHQMPAYMSGVSTV